MIRREIEFLTPAICADLAPRIREDDRAEVLASHGMTDMEKVLINARHLSHESWAWVVDGVPVAAFGVAPASYVHKHGQPWILSTDGIGGENASIFLRNSRIIVNYWRFQWDYLENYVDARNQRAIRWLKFLGFQLHEPAPYGVAGLPFHRFEAKGGEHV